MLIDCYIKCSESFFSTVEGSFRRFKPIHISALLKVPFKGLNPFTYKGIHFLWPLIMGAMPCSKKIYKKSYEGRDRIINRGGEMIIISFSNLKGVLPASNSLVSTPLQCLLNIDNINDDLESGSFIP